MRKNRIEKIGKIAEMAGLDLKILPRKENTHNEVMSLMIKQHNIDGRICQLEDFVKKEGKRSQKETREEIEKLLIILSHILEIDHSVSADKALESYNLLTEKDKLKILPVIDKIRKIRKKINDIANKVDAEKICKDCEGKCCGRIIETSLSEMDFFYMFFVLIKEDVNKIWKILNMPDEGGYECRFKQENGCIIPKEGRPYFCQSYYCGDVPKISGKISDKYGDKLEKQMQKLQKKLKRIGFDLQLDS